MIRFLALFILLLSSPLTSWPAEKIEPRPLLQAHSHNDYEQKRPLLDALDLGFCNIEADVYLVDGKLLVAHEITQVHPDKTLQSLYLDPLRQRVLRHGGWVYGNGLVVTLLIDIKSDAEKTYAVVRETLQGYKDMLTVFQPGKITTNAITVVISGNRARQMMSSETTRYAAFDGRLEDLDSDESSALIAWISDNWQRHFTWSGIGPFPEAEKENLKRIVSKGHQRGRKIRFWATPDRPVIWRELLDAEVDIVIADDLPALQKFLLEYRSGKTNR